MSAFDIYNDETRKKYINKMSPMALNDYLKNMEKLSKKRPEFMEIYNKDLDFLLSSPIKTQKGGNPLINLFMGNTNSTASEVCATETYINRINNITNNTYCPVITQKTKKCDNTCSSRFNELDNIKTVLKEDCRKKTSEWVTAVHRFIEIILCCSSLFGKAEYEPFRDVYFKDISKLIASSPKFTKESFSYMNKIMQNQKNIISEDFMKEYSELRNKKKTMTYTQHKTQKEKLIGDYITKLGQNGFQIVYTSKFVEKIIYAYKNQNK